MAPHNDESRQDEMHQRMGWIAVFFAVFFVVVLIRAYQLQIVGNSKLNQLAEKQYKTRVVVNPRRGTIYDRHGDVLAQDVQVSSIGVHPKWITDKESLATLLADKLKMDRTEIIKKLNSDSKFEWIKRRVDYSIGHEIEKLKVHGVQVLSEYRRFYPNKNLAGQLLGAVGYESQALGGVELSFNKYLMSASVKEQAQRDARGKLFSVNEETREPFHDVYLSIDKNIQSVAEEALAENAIKHKVKSGFALVVDVENGDILAMANWPEFNPNIYWKYPQENWKNHALLNTFEPGSTFKTFLMAAALESGKISPSTKIFCENGSMAIGKNVINDSHPHGTLSAKEVLQVSSNIGVTKIAQKIGKQYFYDFLKDLHIADKMNIGLGGESAGVLRNYKTWKEIEFSNIAFGQGVSVNALQMASAYASLANGGTYNPLNLVKTIVSEDGDEVPYKNTRESKKVLTEETSKEITDMLFSVTQPGGTALLAHVPGYLSAGKTGTAQKYDPETKTYASHDYVSSFIGFSPVKDPKVLVYVVYDTPRANGYYGGTVAGPVFKKIEEKVLAYMGVEPTEDIKTALAQNQTSKKPKKIEAPEKKEPLNRDWSEYHKKKILPDITGLSVRKAVEVLAPFGMPIQVNGSGIVIRQFPKPGADLSKETTVKIELGKKS